MVCEIIVGTECKEQVNFMNLISVQVPLTLTFTEKHLNKMCLHQNISLFDFDNFVNVNS